VNVDESAIRATYHGVCMVDQEATYEDTRIASSEAS
jgi:hypothetical protein